jgi:hypothetical protein
MRPLDSLDVLFIVWNFLFQVILIIHFALRKFHIILNSTSHGGPDQKGRLCAD